MRLASLFSGGKDSTFALYAMLKQGWEVKYLVTMLSEREDSWMFHHPCIKLTKLQAEALGIQQIAQKTSGEKEKELEDLLKVLKSIKEDVDGIVSGAIASRYQKDRIDAICKELDLKSLTPLWGKDPRKLLREEVDSNFEIIITSVSSAGFDESWLGRRINLKTISELEELQRKHGINLAAEGGEYETFVIDGPIFRKKIEFIDVQKLWDNKTLSGYIEVKGAKLVPKS